jgi:hypothetical protein
MITQEAKDGQKSRISFVQIEEQKSTKGEGYGRPKRSDGVLFSLLGGDHLYISYDSQTSCSGG